MSESEIEGFINKVESGLVEAQHDMLVEKALYNRPVVISDGNGGVVEVSAKQLLNYWTFASFAPHALKGQKLLAQGSALGNYGRKPVAL